jgi:hypothetical protein
MAAPERIILGSGKLFITLFEDSIPEDSVIEVETNRIGHIKGGATLEYAPEFYIAKDDLGQVQKSRLVNEEVKLKSGIMTLNGNSIAKLCATARVDETKSGKRTVKIGGAANDDGKMYLIRFLHEDEADGDIRLTIVGRNESGFSMAFAKDAETVVDAEFTAFPNDSEGTLIIYDEDVKSTT